MAILLKTISFAIWLIIMIALIIGSRRPSSVVYDKATLILEKDDNLETKIK
ncbi:MAG: hypothetical protein GX790_08605 [Syntrophomonadaceae bacterium]|nr:hypothetical protein [Syntrophomonadaceae bacterium]